MMNDDLQVWHGSRDKYHLSNPWTTEEGFATLNTYQTMPSSLLYPQALRYWAVCRSAQMGFVELFHELTPHYRDPTRRWHVCCRMKRGMLDTSLPGWITSLCAIQVKVARCTVPHLHVTCCQCQIFLDTPDACQALPRSSKHVRVLVGGVRIAVECATCSTCFM